MKVDVENKLSEKRSKQLATSLNRMLRDFLKTFKDIKQYENSNINIKFNNNEIFSFGIIYENNNNIVCGYSYINKYGEKQEEIPLQAALNIIKYTREIENMFKTNLKDNTLEAYFTEQSIDKIPIFKEKEKDLERKTVNEPIEKIEVENVLYDERDDF